MSGTALQLVPSDHQAALAQFGAEGPAEPRFGAVTTHLGHQQQGAASQPAEGQQQQEGHGQERRSGPIMAALLRFWVIIRQA